MRTSSYTTILLSFKLALSCFCVGQGPGTFLPDRDTIQAGSAAETLFNWLAGRSAFSCPFSASLDAFLKFVSEEARLVGLISAVSQDRGSEELLSELESVAICFINTCPDLRCLMPRRSTL